MKSICLNLISKNESKNILSCLNSAKGIIDYVYILDTGSTDDTRHLIEEWAKETGIPTTIGNHPFTNFGEARTLAFNLAKSTYKSDYTLLMDARHILNGSIDREGLDADCYTFLQIRVSLHYNNTRLIRTSLPWVCKAVVHEYWECPSAVSKHLESAHITENGIEADKSGKITWYKKLLKEGIEKETDPFLTARYIFYLANSHFDLAEYQDAITCYLRRTSLGGWIEEQWYCNYRIGISYEHLGQPEAAIGYYLKCVKLLPTRAESFYRLASLYRGQDDLLTSLHYARIGKDIPKPDGLFVESHIYDYLMDFEVSISGYYMDREVGRQSQVKLMSKIDDIPESYASQIKANEKWYH